MIRRCSHRKLLFIDSGNPDLGAARFEDGQMRKVVWLKLKRPKDSTCPACWARRPCRHAVEPRLITDLCDALEREFGIAGLEVGDPGLPDALVCETPIYFAQKQKQLRGGTPVLKLTGVVGALTDRAAAWGAAAYTYKPSEWKGNAKKIDHQVLALMQFSEEELALLPRVGRSENWYYPSDAVDAAALGQWFTMQAGLRQAVRNRRSPLELRKRLRE